MEVMVRRAARRLAPGLESIEMRICSFLPSATEMIAELGFIDSLVGVSEECRWPPEVIGKPIVTAARIDPSSMSSLEIDEAVTRRCAPRFAKGARYTWSTRN